MERLIGGKADGRPDSAFDKKKLREGMDEEKEHTKDPQIAKEIAKDHLAEDKNYYRKLKHVVKEPSMKSLSKSQSNDELVKSVLVGKSTASDLIKATQNDPMRGIILLRELRHARTNRQAVRSVDALEGEKQLMNKVWEKSMNPKGQNKEGDMLMKKDVAKQPMIKDKMDPKEKKQMKDQQQEEEDPSTKPGTTEYHRDRAMAHLAAAQAHANAHMSAKKIEDTKDHKSKVSEAEKLSQLTQDQTAKSLRKNNLIIGTSADDELAKSLENGMPIDAMADAYSNPQSRSVLGHLQKATIYQGEDSGPRGGDYREEYVRLESLANTQEDDPAGNACNGGLVEWFKDSFDGNPQVNVPVNMKDISKSDEPVQVYDDSDPYYRAIARNHPQDGQAGIQMVYRGEGRELAR